MATLLQGLVLLVSGMGIVFLFLTLLVWVMNRSSALVIRFNHILPDEEPKKKSRPTQQNAHDDFALVAIALAAIKARTA